MPESRPLDALRPARRHARVHPPAQIAKLKASLTRFGWCAPMLITADGEIVAGVARWQAARELGMTEAPVVVLGRLSPAEIEAYRIADNRLAELAAWDEAALAEIMRDLERSFDLDALGFDERTVAKLVADIAHIDAEPPAPASPDRAPELRTRPGEVWQLGAHRLVCGDATDAGVLDRLMAGDAAATVVFTDPPYGMDYRSSRLGGIEGDRLAGEALTTLVRASLGNARRHAAPDAAFYVCLTWRTWREFEDGIDGAGLAIDACIVWDKGWIGPGTLHYRPRHEFIWYCRGARWFGGPSEADVWQFPRDPAQAYAHPTQKPVALAERAMRNSSRRGDVVLDPFGGSGSTLMACERNARAARLIELDPKWCDAIVNRWEAATGRTACRATA